MQAQAPTHASLLEALLFLSITVEVATFSALPLSNALFFTLFACYFSNSVLFETVHALSAPFGSLLLRFSILFYLVWLLSFRCFLNPRPFFWRRRPECRLRD